MVLTVSEDEGRGRRRTGDDGGGDGRRRERAGTIRLTYSLQLKR